MAHANFRAYHERLTGRDERAAVRAKAQKLEARRRERSSAARQRTRRAVLFCLARLAEAQRITGAALAEKLDAERAIRDDAREREKSRCRQRDIRAERPKTTTDKADRKRRLSAAAAECRAITRRASASTRAIFERAARALRAERDAERAFSAALCAARKTKLKSHVRGRVAQAKAAIREDIDLRRGARRVARPAKRGPSAAEARAQSDHETEADIEVNAPRLLPLWHRVKRSIVAGRNRSRLETFYEYAESLGDSNELAEADDAAMAAGEEEARQHYAGLASTKPGRPVSAARKASGATARNRAAGVPF